METLTFEKWVEIYSPRQNPLTKEGSYSNTAFETYGEEMEIVLKVKENTIWTLISCDNEEQYIIPGYHIVNRYLYFITEIPYKSEDIQVNDNEMISNIDAKIACINFFKEFDIELSVNEVSDFFESNLDDTFVGEMTVGRAKYLAIEFYESIYDELFDDMENDIHDYYSQLS